jgi:hypothetical protein
MTDYTSWALMSMKETFEDPETTDDTRKEILKEVQQRATEATPENICKFSKEREVVFQVPWHEALIPGHIYSQEGLAEFAISHTCEYHFDKWTTDLEEASEGNDPL